MALAGVETSLWLVAFAFIYTRPVYFPQENIRQTSKDRLKSSRKASTMPLGPVGLKQLEAEVACSIENAGPRACRDMDRGMGRRKVLNPDVSLGQKTFAFSFMISRWLDRKVLQRPAFPFFDDFSQLTSLTVTERACGFSMSRLPYMTFRSTYLYCSWIAWLRLYCFAG